MYSLLIFTWVVGPILSEAAGLSCTPDVLTVDNVSISWANYLPAGSNFTVPSEDVGFPTSPTRLGASCVLQAEVQKLDNSTYNFGMFLPDDWNGRFLTVGNAGFAGGVNWGSMADGLGYGFAVMSSDLGHNSTAIDASWAYEQPGKLADWGYLALHGSVEYAKRITEQYYNNSIQYSYYRGCSAGGKQGLKEAEMYPADFDGVVAGAPAWWTTHLQLWNGWVGIINTPSNASYHVPRSFFPTLAAEVLRQCDPQDGVIDNIIMNPLRCEFRPETLLCAPDSTNSTTCLQPAQLDTIYKWYNDWVEANQTYIFSHFLLGSEWQWNTPIGLLNSDTPSALGTDYVEYMLGLGPTWSWETQWNSAELVALSDKMNPGNATAGNFDLSSFYKKGGKLLHYHGLSDGSIATGSSIYFYNHVARSLVPQGIELDDFYRLFLVPGMGHCYNTAEYMNAPWVFGGDGQAAALGSDVSGVPGFQDPEHDVLRAVMAWVENGTAPERIVATKYVNDSMHSDVLSQRPLCVYPKQAVWDRSGRVEEASGWKCRSVY